MGLAMLSRRPARCLCRYVSDHPFPNRTGTLSMHPALRLDTVSVLDFLEGFAILTAHVTGPTHDQRFPLTSGHDFGPTGFFSSSVLVQVFQCPYVVDGDTVM